MVAAAPLAAVVGQQHLLSSKFLDNAHLQQEGGAHGFHPRFHRVHALSPRRTQSIRRAQVLI